MVPSSKCLHVHPSHRQGCDLKSLISKLKMTFIVGVALFRKTMFIKHKFSLL